MELIKFNSIETIMGLWVQICKGPCVPRKQNFSYEFLQWERCIGKRHFLGSGVNIYNMGNGKLEGQWLMYNEYINILTNKIFSQPNSTSTQVGSDKLLRRTTTPPPPPPPLKLPGNLGSWFSVCNLILTQLDEIRKTT